MLKYVRDKKNSIFLLNAVIALLLTFYVMSSHVRAQDPVAAGQRGMDWLTPATLNWQRSTGCFGCHIQGQTLWGLPIGRSQGYRIDPAALQEIVDLLKTIQSPDGTWSVSDDSRHRIDATAYAVSGLSFYDKLVTPPPTPAQSNLLMAAEFLLSNQQADGHWDFGIVGPPIAGSPIWTTVRNIIAVNRTFEVTQDARFRDSRERAIAWLKVQTPSSNFTTQDLAFILIGLKEGGVPANDPVLMARRDSLFGLQNPDKGWGHFSGWPSNSYNTGQVVYALRLVGATLADPRIGGGINWLIANQNPDGSWPTGSSGISTQIAATMWPVIALGRFGVFGVEVVLTVERQELVPLQPVPQAVTYPITITNLGNITDTYTLNVSGGLPGWTAALSAGEVTLAEGASQTVTLTVTAPPDLPNNLSTTHTVTATSRTDPAVTATGSVTTFTPPPPPPCGPGQVCGETLVNIIRGDGAVGTQCDTIPIEIVAMELTGMTPISGPGIGTVNFLVGGTAIGSDTDEDGDGIFGTLWTPGQDWTRLGTQPLVAAYSGLDRPDPEIDLSPSFATGTITINPAVCDSIHPTTSIASISPSPNANGWNNTPVTVSLIATDNEGGSGVKEIHYNLSGATTGAAIVQGNTAQALITVEGTTTIAFWAVDNAGNAEAQQSVTIMIDKTPPIVNVSRDPAPNANGWNNTPVNVTFSATDNLSGVDIPIELVSMNLQGANQSVSRTFTDRAGNSATATASGINIDFTPPTITVSRTPLPNPNGWNNTDVQAHFGASDNLSGIVGDSFFDVFFTVEGADQSAGWGAMDRAGNSASATISGINIDKTPPSITGAPTTPPNANGWYNNCVTVGFACGDGLSGVDNCSSDTSVCTEGENQCAMGTACDRAGNCATTDVCGINIDTTPPVTQITLSGTFGVSCYGSDVFVGCSASDNLSGVESTLCNLDETGWSSCSGGFTVMDEGLHTVICKSTDMAGNTGVEQSVSFTIDKTPPEVVVRFNPTSRDIDILCNEDNCTVSYVVLPPMEDEDEDEHGKELRQYTLTDCAMNSLVMVLEHKKEGNEVKVEVLSLQYNGGTIIEVAKNKMQAEYAVDKNGALRELHQKIKVKDQFEVKAKFNAQQNETRIRVELEGQDEQKETRAGLVILELLTDNGSLKLGY